MAAFRSWGTLTLSIPSKETLQGKPTVAVSIEPAKTGRRQISDAWETVLCNLATYSLHTEALASSY